ncbi:hypothetical protein TrVFT333_000263 [Trichoderma virens FT-333]|nr:hypothetical protein TrVFT333_000263 [Trichoderma virens FT-333]
MDLITNNLNNLNLNRRTYVGFGDENTPDHVPLPDHVPFCPSSNFATKLHDIPRYLFRVYSDTSAGENNSQWMKSPDALKNNLTDIFTRDASTIAVTLNKHLRWWPKSNGDPFISWTTSLLFAIQHAIFKHKKEQAELNTIYLCIIDTTEFPDGVFVKELDLIEEFHDKVPDKDSPYNWKKRGLSSLYELRNKKHRTYSGVYNFGEYLSQGQTNINARSCTVPCDKIINNHLFAIMPQFRLEMEDNTPSLAEAVIKLREPFYHIMEQGAINNYEFAAAKAIALEFKAGWSLPVLANLLALNPRTTRDSANIDLIWEHFSDEEKYNLSSKCTNVVANVDIPEVLRFGKIIQDINKDYYAKSAASLVRSMKETTDIVRRFIRDSKSNGGRKMLGTGNLADHLPTVGRHVLPLIQSLGTLSEIIQDLQEDKT